MESRSDRILNLCQDLDYVREEAHDHPDAVEKNIQGVLNSSDPEGTTKKIEKLTDVLRTRQNNGSASSKQVQLADKLEKVLAGLKDRM